MTHRSHILGFVEMTEGTVRRNEAEIAEHDYPEESWPFRQCLILPARKVYASYGVPIFDCVKCDPEDWPLWINQFEQVLAKLDFVLAKVAFFAERGDAIRVSFGKLDDDMSRMAYRLSSTMLSDSPDEWFA